ncbi:MAG: hypothetical protein QW343_00940 [Candidatus Norongarragalinales archaeon]
MLRVSYAGAKQKRKKRKAQIAIELFLAMTLFLLALYWTSYFVSTVRESKAVLVGEENLALASLVQAANAACAVNTSITLSLPCLWREAKTVNYSLKANGVDNAVWLVPEESGAPWISKQALCNFSSFSLKARCEEKDGVFAAGVVCLNLSSESIGVWKGACS